MRPLTLHAGLASAALLSFSTAATAAPLAVYGFDGAENGVNATTTNGGDAAAFAPSSTADGLSASRLSATGGGTTDGVRLGNDDQGVYPDQALVVGTTGSNAFSPDDFFGLTLTPDAGNTLDLDTLTLDAARGGGSARGFRVRSSVDGFAADLNDASTEAIPTQRPAYTAYTVDLGAAEFDDLQGPVSFRFYVYSSGTNNTLEFDDIRFNGEVSAVPEPGSLALLGGVGLLAFRRRR